MQNKPLTFLVFFLGFDKREIGGKEDDRGDSTGKWRGLGNYLENIYWLHFSFTYSWCGRVFCVVRKVTDATICNGHGPPNLQVVAHPPRPRLELLEKIL